MVCPKQGEKRDNILNNNGKQAFPPGRVKKDTMGHKQPSPEFLSPQVRNDGRSVDDGYFF
jgi:hypothetical protein